MAEYISKESVLKAFKLTAKNPNKDYQRGMQDTIDCLVPEVIADIPTADVQPIVYAHKTINVGRRSYCSNCGKLAIMEDFCSKCGAKVKDGEPTRNLTDEETEIYESWIDHEAKDTGVNIIDCEQNENN